MVDTPYGVVARRTRPSSVASLRGRATHAPRTPESVQSDTTVIVTSVKGGAGEPQSGFPDGAGGRGGSGEGRKAVVVDVPVIMLLEFQQSKSHEKLEVLQIQLIVGLQDIPVVSQRQVPTVLSFVLQVQFLEVVDMPVVAQRQVLGSMVAVAVHRRSSTFLSCRRSFIQQTIAIHLLQCVDKVVHVPVVQVVQVSQVPVVEETDGSHSCSSLRKSLRSQPVLGQGCCMPVGVQQQVS